MKNYHVLGVMTGSSLDGVDIVYTKITASEKKYSYEILMTDCVKMPAKWKLRISQLVLQNAVTYLKTSAFFGQFLGEILLDFITRNQIENQLDFIASHGQTIFHQPENKFSSQIGDGSVIAAITGFPVICDFRSVDVALGGQGAPVAPIANKLFYPEYSLFLNLGGIGNLAANINGKYVAFDFTAVNLILDKIAKELELEYDDEGKIAAFGNFSETLFDSLNHSIYYNKSYPKSLSGGWVSKVMLPIISRSPLSHADKLHTVVYHVAYQLKNAISMIEAKENISFSKNDKMLATGGGVFNRFLMQIIQEKIGVSVTIPDHQIIKFNEAVLMALMGVMRVRQETNIMSSVTGATYDTIGGAIYEGWKKQLSFEK